MDMTLPTVEMLVAGVKNAVDQAFADVDTWTREQQKSNAFFTNRLFPRLRDLARQLGLDVRMKSENPPNSQFLYDVSFLVTTGAFNDANGDFVPHATLKRVVLALECEWESNDEGILYDFSKLLVLRNGLRVLVFYRSSEDRFRQVLQRINAALNAFADGSSSDRYLVCALVAGSRRFVFLDGQGMQLEAS
jgi:hypothetical protein